MSQPIDERTKVYEILNGFSTAMFVTLGSEGRPGARPMHVARIEQNTSTIWFFTNQSSALMDELEKEPVVLLTFQNDSSAYASVRGHAFVEHDKARIQDLWKAPYKVWFPKGPEDPDIALLAVQLLDAEYWDNRGMNKLEYLFEAAKAYVKGHKPEAIEEQHAKTAL
jgi:general stress protein 26